MDVYRCVEIITVLELPDGYAFTFAARSEVLMQVAQPRVVHEENWLYFLSHNGGDPRFERFAKRRFGQIGKCLGNDRVSGTCIFRLPTPGASWSKLRERKLWRYRRKTGGRKDRNLRPLR
jgi:hypothetical protein